MRTTRPLCEEGNLPTDTNCGDQHEMMLPGNLVARIIGKGGEITKALQEETGANIVIIQESREYAAAAEKPLTQDHRQP